MFMMDTERKSYITEVGPFLVTKVAKDDFLNVTCNALCENYQEVFVAYGINGKDVSDYIKAELLEKNPDIHIEFIRTCISFFYEEFKKSGKKFDKWQKAFAEAIDMACIYFCNCVGLEIEVNNVLHKKMVSILKS